MIEVLTIVAFFVAIGIAPLAWVRMLTAKTSSEYLKNIALFVLPILVVLGLADASGMFVEAPQAPAPKQIDVPPFDFNTGQMLLLGMAGFIWIAGVNVLFHRHRKRMNRSWWSSLNPFEPPFKDFNRQEWATLGVLLVISLGLGLLALNMGQPR